MVQWAAEESQKGNAEHLRSTCLPFGTLHASIASPAKAESR